MKRIFLIDDTDMAWRHSHGFPMPEELEKYIKSGRLIVAGCREEVKANAILDQDTCVIMHESFPEDDVKTAVRKRKLDCRIPALITISDGYSKEDASYEGGKGFMPKEDFYKDFSKLMASFNADGEIGHAELAEYVCGVTSSSVASSKKVSDVMVFNFEDAMNLPVLSMKWIEHIDGFIADTRNAMDARKKNETLPTPDGYVIAFDLSDLSPRLLQRARTAALYIRLALRKSRRLGFLPMVFYSAEATEKMLAILVDNNTMATDIFFCGGSQVLGGVTDKSSFPIEKLKLHGLAYTDPTTKQTSISYKPQFFDRIKVVPNAEKSGNHSIANYWGAYVLGRAIESSVKHPKLKDNLRVLLSDVMDRREPLYLHYLTVQGLSSEQLEEYFSDFSERSRDAKDEKSFALPKMENRRVLYIDDQDDIWGPVIRAMFSDKVDIIGKSIIEQNLESEDLGWLLSTRTEGKWKLEDYDLILLDLRLRGDEEEGVRGKELSGLKLLRKLMDYNRGLRVIMFTSSNKAWNLGLALQNGAAGYYMKESPEVKSTIEESSEGIQSLLDTVEKCFREFYLRDEVESLRLLDKRENENLQDALSQLEIALNMIFTASKSGKTEDYEYAYVALEQVFEIVKWDDSDYIDGTTKVAEAVIHLYIDDRFSVEESRKLKSDIWRYVTLRNGIVHKQIYETKAVLLNKFISLWDFTISLLKHCYQI